MAAPPALIRIRRSALWRLGWRGLALLLVLAGAGLLWFALQADRDGPLPARADGIVVLTGGAGRLELGLRLLAERRAARLLVSGTGRGELADLAAAAGLRPALLARIDPAAVTLGRDARSTRGNARETADWVAAHRLESVIVVTSGYHMRRALMEMRRTLPPGVALLPVPLVPHLPGGRDQVPLRLLLAEYAKFLGALAGLSGWVARQEEAAPHAPPAPGAIGRGINERGANE